MSDGPFIFLLLAVFYLVECLVWAPAGTWLFACGGTGKWTFKSPAAGLANDRGRFSFLNPLPWAAGSCLAEEWRFSAGRSGLTNIRVAAPGQARRLLAVPVFLTRESWGLLEACDRSVKRRGGATLAGFLAPAVAVQWADTLRDIAKPGAWPQDVREAFSPTLAADELGGRTLIYEAARRRLGLLGIALFLLLFLAAPLFLQLGGGMRLYVVFALIILHDLAAAVVFFRAHRRLYPKQRADRFLQAFQIALVPTHAIRAADLLGRGLCGTAHPLAAGKQLLDGAAFRRLAAIFARDLTNSLRLPESGEDHVQAAREFHRDVELPLVERFLADSGLDWKELTAIPAGDATPAAVCPRCLTSFSSEVANCSDCDGVATVAVAAPIAGGGRTAPGH